MVPFHSVLDEGHALALDRVGDDRHRRTGRRGLQSRQQRVVVVAVHDAELEAERRQPGVKGVQAVRVLSAGTLLEAVPVDDSNADLGEGIELLTVAGVDQLELAMLVRRGDAITLITNDIIGNVAHPVGPGARIMSRLMGFGPTPRIPRVARRMFIKDTSALAGQLRDWAGMAGLERLIPSHGEIIDEEPAAVLLRLAQSLDN